MTRGWNGRLNDQSLITVAIATVKKNSEESDVFSWKVKSEVVQAARQSHGGFGKGVLARGQTAT